MFGQWPPTAETTHTDLAAEKSLPCMQSTLFQEQEDFFFAGSSYLDLCEPSAPPPGPLTQHGVLFKGILSLWPSIPVEASVFQCALVSIVQSSPLWITFNQFYMTTFEWLDCWRSCNYSVGLLSTVEAAVLCSCCLWCLEFHVMLQMGVMWFPVINILCNVESFSGKR